MVNMDSTTTGTKYNICTGVHYRFYFRFSLFPCHSSDLEDFDLTGGRVKMFCVLSILVLLKRVNLDAERHALFSAMLPHGEFCANAVNLKRKRI